MQCQKIKVKTNKTFGTFTALLSADFTFLPLNIAEIVIPFFTPRFKKMFLLEAGDEC